MSGQVGDLTHTLQIVFVTETGDKWTYSVAKDNIIY